MNDENTPLTLPDETLDTVSGGYGPCFAMTTYTCCYCQKGSTRDDVKRFHGCKYCARSPFTEKTADGRLCVWENDEPPAYLSHSAPRP